MGASAIIALLGALLPSAITAAEKIFGPQTGTVKLAAVTSAVSPVLQAAATAGKTTGSVIPSDITTAIESVLTALKSVGAVPASTPAQNTQAITTPQTVKISGTLTVG
jgi:hypothetical protein